VAAFTKRALKDLDALPPMMRTRARALASRLDNEPGLGWKLKGKLAGTSSVNLGRSHRMLFTVGDDTVIIKAIRPRKDVYRA
jgi:mRNA-degrading endonuclease RelE of RelBE toxin-antitoxin system